MNKNIKIELAVGIILFIAVAVGGFVWLGNRKQQVTDKNQSASTSDKSNGNQQNDSKDAASSPNLVPPKETAEQTQPQPISSPAVGSSSPVSAPESIPEDKEAINLTGRWTGKFKVTLPEKCFGLSGSWTADIVQSGSSFSGTYQSSSVSGVVSGSYIGTSGFEWIVTGGGGARLRGSIASSKVVEGRFGGSLCPGTSQRIEGTFSGGR